LAPCFISLTLAISISDAQEKILDKPFSLDHLKSNLIPAEDRIALHPKELVAILGSERGRGWGTIGRFTFSPDGKTIACVAGSWVLYLWDATTLVEREAIEITPRPGSPGIFELAFSPDGKRLYVDDSAQRNIRVYDFQPDGTLRNGRIFSKEPGGKGEGVPDGMKLDRAGNLYVTGPGGIWIWDSDGNHLGTIILPEQPANLAWGDSDLKTLYITATASLYKLKTSAPGFVPYLAK